MKSLILIACLAFSCAVEAGEEHGQTLARQKEPVSGLVKICLSPTELGPGSARQIRLLLDPQAQPPKFVPSTNDLPGGPDEKPDPVDPALPFQRELDRIGGEAVAYLTYRFENNWFFVKIVRFPTVKDAGTYWQKREKEGKSHLMGSPAGNVLYTQQGKQLRPGVNARMGTVECTDGRYVVRLAPSVPGDLDHDPGLKVLTKQMEKIGKTGEPAAGGNAE